MTPTQSKTRRIRDSLHGLIFFGANDKRRTESFVDDCLWNVIQTPSFQRLRRIKQLGFSDLVYPGATHTRFAHSVGVLHTARRLLKVIRDKAPTDAQNPTRESEALAAALLHDVGHGPFSHAFEEALKNLGDSYQDNRHEAVGARFILEGEIRKELERHFGSESIQRIAEMVDQKMVRQKNRADDIYDSVVSSQFDADRLDYMLRDRRMTGVEHSSLAFDWLLTNLEIHNIPTSTKARAIVGEKVGFAIGPKAIHAAEEYVLGLFQLYPTVYFHKVTRCAEVIFTRLIRRVFEIACDDSSMIEAQSGLPASNPIIGLARDPVSIERNLELDDTVIWGSLSQMTNAKDQMVKAFSSRLRNRHMYRCVNIRTEVAKIVDPEGCALDPERNNRHVYLNKISECADKICEELENESISRRSSPPIILVDNGKREPYKEIVRGSGELEQIYVRLDDEVTPKDLSKCSLVVGGLQTFEFSRAYYDPESSSHRERIMSVISNVAGSMV